MMDRMIFHEFVMRVQEVIKEWLPAYYENADVEIHSIRRPGGGYTGLTVTAGGQHGAPIINLDEYYERYEAGEKWKDLMRSMADTLEQRLLIPDTDWIGDYAVAKDSLFLRICNPKNNEELLSGLPCRIVADLALTCHIMLETVGGGMYSTPVTWSMAEQWGTEKDRLFADAFQSGAALFPARLETMEGMLSGWIPGIGAAESGPGNSPEYNPGNSFGNDGTSFSRTADQMLIVSNRQMLNGAAALFYPGVMEEAAEIMKGGYYVIPSSVHELILVPESFVPDYRKLEQIVRKVNRLQVEPQDRLSDCVYHYDDVLKQFERADYFENRRAVSKQIN